MREISEAWILQDYERVGYLVNKLPGSKGKFAPTSEELVVFFLYAPISGICRRQLPSPSWSISMSKWWESRAGMPCMTTKMPKSTHPWKPLFQGKCLEKNEHCVVCIFFVQESQDYMWACGLLQGSSFCLHFQKQSLGHRSLVAISWEP